MNLEDLDIPAWVKKAWAEPFTKGDILFRSVKAGEGDAGDWETNAWLQGGTSYAYAEGYRRAGRILADYVIQNRWDTDFLAYPIVFLYRHNIELQLKMLIEDSAYLAGVGLPKADRHLITGSHRLDHLWARLEVNLRKLANDGFGIEAADIDAAASYVRQIHCIDEGSFSFRYVNTKAGTPSIAKEKLPYLNIGVLAAGMEKLIGFLFGLGQEFSVAAQAEAEMAADYGDDGREYYGEY